MRKNVNTLRGIRTHDLSVQAIKAFTSDRASSATGKFNGQEVMMYRYCTAREPHAARSLKSLERFERDSFNNI
jgi:hypothetical protein